MWQGYLVYPLTWQSAAGETVLRQYSFFNCSSLDCCRNAESPLQHGVKMPELPCSSYLCQKLAFCSTVLHVGFFFFFFCCLMRQSRLCIPCCCNKAAPGIFTSSQKASWSIPALQCLCWSWSWLGSTVHISRIADISVYFPWAFLSIPPKAPGELSR